MNKINSLLLSVMLLGACYTATAESAEGVSEQLVQTTMRSAEQGDVTAQLNLGEMYFDGEGVEQDHTQALYWYRQAAEQGHAEGQFNMGRMYHIGWGVEKDYAQAANWYRQAAEQGHAEAQFSLGMMYSSGREGVEQDDTQAVYWYRQAAEQEHALAQGFMGTMYKFGHGVQRDMSLASEWYARSCDNGNQNSCNSYQQINSQDAR